MADRKIKIRTRMQDGQVEVQALIYHPMETGQRTDPKTKDKIPAHFIRSITLEHNGKTVVEVNTGIGVSQDPLLGFRLKNAKNGDKLKISWRDVQIESGNNLAVVDVS